MAEVSDSWEDYFLEESYEHRVFIQESVLRSLLQRLYTGECSTLKENKQAEA